MFEKELKNDRIETLIGEKCVIKGNLKGEGLLKVDGLIDGNLDWQQDIIIGTDSKIKGNISCINACVNGFVDGNIICENILTIESFGKVKGDITVKNVIIKEGGWLDGKCTMVTQKKDKEPTE
ncbi:bactofilin family protein [Clostridium polynesiense]|uniref:bactofilin family protein n=1 Tax=Clostridium polynesiense TaxID=1325933 RepID=UPI00058CF27F|nr:polymer-forming cytoskeletal protein [Clostridium polynesiense]